MLSHNNCFQLEKLEKARQKILNKIKILELEIAVNKHQLALNEEQIVYTLDHTTSQKIKANKEEWKERLLKSSKK